MEIWGYETYGRKRFAILNSSSVSTTFINSIENRQTLGKCKHRGTVSFSSFTDLKNYLKKNEINYELADRLLWSD